MTDTELKLKDAGIQLKLALDAFAARDEEQLRSCINAFISHARSITFVMQVESHPFPLLAKWYVERMNAMRTNPLMRFYNEKRVHSVHKGVVKANRRTVRIEKITVAGKTVATGGTAALYEFDGVEEFLTPDRGKEVFNLSEQYFLLLKHLVMEWLEVRASLSLPQSLSDFRP